MLSKLLRYETLLVAVAPVLGYIILSNYYEAMGRHYSLNIIVGSPDLLYSINIGIILLIGILIASAVAGLISKIMLVGANPWLLRVKRITQVFLFLTTVILLALVQDNSNATSKLLAVTIIISPIIISLIIWEIFIPRFKYRKLNRIERALEIQRSNQSYTSVSEYMRHLFKGSRIILLVVPLLLVMLLAQIRGYEAADITKPRTYTLIHKANSTTNEQQIILVDYGTSWLVAKYDDSFPSKPAYRKQYQVIDSDNMGTYILQDEYIKELYVYN